LLLNVAFNIYASQGGCNRWWIKGEDAKDGCQVRSKQKYVDKPLQINVIMRHNADIYLHIPLVLRYVFIV